ncbi:MAG: PorT family protein [Bacteroidia bacterium]|nr:PorT family protein [Bacteroidia bacterium]
MRYIVGITFLSLLSVSSQVFGQASTCTQTLRLVQSTYEQGRLHELETLMGACLINGFDDQQKLQAYRYLTLAYIYLEEPEKADAAMLNLLNTDHFFEPVEGVDPAEFIALYRKFRVRPLYRFGFKLGPTATMPAIQEIYSVNANAQGNGKYSPSIGFSLGLVFEKDFPDFIKKFSIAPEVVFITRSYNYANTLLNESDQNPGNAVISQDPNLQKQSWLDLNLLVQYKIKENKFNPYISVGPGLGLLLKSTNEIETGVEGQGSITGSSVDTKESYKSLAYSAILSIGSKFRLGGFYLTGDIRYQYGLNNLVNTSSRGNAEALFDYGYVPSNYSQNNFTINLGLVIPYFSPKKLIN